MKELNIQKMENVSASGNIRCFISGPMLALEISIVHIPGYWTSVWTACQYT